MCLGGEIFSSHRFYQVLGLNPAGLQQTVSVAGSAEKASWRKRDTR